MTEATMLKIVKEQWHTFDAETKDSNLCSALANLFIKANASRSEVQHLIELISEHKDRALLEVW